MRHGPDLASPGPVHDAFIDVQRVLADQIGLLKETQQRNEHLIRTTLAILGAVLALVIALIRGDGPDLAGNTVLIAIVPGTLLDILALRAFLGSSYGHRWDRDLLVDPTPSTILERLHAQDQNKTTRRLIRRGIKMFTTNKKTLDRALLRQRWGIRWMFTALIFQTLAISYILWSVMA